MKNYYGKQKAVDVNRPLPLFIPVLSFPLPFRLSLLPPLPCLYFLLPLDSPSARQRRAPTATAKSPGKAKACEKPWQSRKRGLPRDSPLRMRINLCYLKIFLLTPSPDPLPGPRSEFQTRIRCPALPGVVCRARMARIPVFREIPPSIPM